MAGSLPPPQLSAKQPGLRAPDPARSIAFVSYSRTDMEYCERIRHSLEQVGCDAWYDNNARKGGQWWADILTHIRSCDVFIFLVSPMSLASPSCIAERAYAKALHKPTLPVLVRSIDKTDLTKLAESEQRTNFPSLLEDTTASGIGLGDAYRKMAAERRAPPDHPPPEPEAPITDLTSIRTRIAARELEKKEEAALVVELCDLERQVDHLPAVLDLVRTLLRRDQLLEESVDELNALAMQLARSLRSEGLALSRDNWRTPRSPKDLRKEDGELSNRLAPLRRRIKQGKLAPILGWGMAEPLIGPLQFMLMDWANRLGWPGGQRARDLPAAAQYVKVKRGRSELMGELVEGLGRQLVEWNGLDPSAAPSTGAEFDRLLTEVWRRELARRPDALEGRDPYTMLAGLPCPVYVVAHPWSLMAEALRDEGKDPVVEVCRWRPDASTPDQAAGMGPPPGWPPLSKLLTTSPGDAPYEPTPEQPLVYHVFGHIDYESSLVLTEEDHLDFLINVARATSSKDALIPPAVRSKLAQAAVLLLGFELEETASRVLMRSLANQTKLLADDQGPPPNVGTQDATALETPDPQYLDYVTENFRGSNPKLGVVWGRADEFTQLLADEITRNQ